MTTDLHCISPIDQSVFASRPVLDETSAFAVAEKACAAQKNWAQTPLETRIELVLAAIGNLGAMDAEIVPELAAMMGRPVRFGG